VDLYSTSSWTHL